MRYDLGNPLDFQGEEPLPTDITGPGHTFDTKLHRQLMHSLESRLPHDVIWAAFPPEELYKDDLEEALSQRYLLGRPLSLRTSITFPLMRRPPGKLATPFYQMGLPEDALEAELGWFR